MEGLKVRDFIERDHAIVMDIAESLGEWFTPDGLRNISRDIRFQSCLIAEVDGRPIGFLSFFARDGIGWIGWMGVLPGYQRNGIGSALLRAVADRMRGAGIEELRVSTLGDSVDYEPYERTRAFYKRAGFVEHQRILREDPNCPEQLILRMTIHI